MAIDFPIMIPEMAAIPLDLLMRTPHSPHEPHTQAMMDPGEIPDLIELIDAFQRDILGSELSLTSLTDGLATLNHSRNGITLAIPSNGLDLAGDSDFG
jgi:hypothetical protein